MCVVFVANNSTHGRVDQLVLCLGLHQAGPELPHFVDGALDVQLAVQAWGQKGNSLLATRKDPQWKAFSKAKARHLFLNEL